MKINALNIFLIAVLLQLSFCTKKNSAVQLSVSSASEQFAAAGGSREIAVSSNVAWNVTDTSAWCLTTVISDGNDGKFSILIQPNALTVSRSTTIIIAAGNVRKELVVQQQGRIPDEEEEVVVVPDSIAPDETGMRNITAIQLASEMIIGWNLGNSLDAIGGETAWGNPMVNKQLIDSVKKAGFNAVRIPVAWSRFSNETTYTIDTIWMRRVEQVVNYVLDNDMYAIINIHWDNGWMQPTYQKQDYVNDRLQKMWLQIAKRFRNYDDHLLFAGTNEVMVDGDYGPPTAEYYTVQNSFNQTFVSTVRSTGGRNAYRHLVVQGFNTNIDYTIDHFVAPVDATPNRMMVEVHYYDPYNFTLNESPDITQWGNDATDPARTETWANESYADAQFQKMKTKFVDNGYAVILGEYGAIARLNLGSEALNNEHAAFRKYYLEYITQSIKAHGLIPFYWDNGYTGDKSMGLFNRSDGSVAHRDILAAIIGNE